MRKEYPQAEGTADANALRWDCLRIRRKQPVWLERSEKRGGCGDERDWGAGTRPVGCYRILEGRGLFSSWNGAEEFEQRKDII